MARVLIGTSGWHYDSWRGPFFPEGLPLKDQLPYYASQFPTTELNGVFYRTPSLETVRTWRARTGHDFMFAWKASKFITHWKRLSPNSVNSLALIEERLRLLAAKAGPILFQLPPNFRADAGRLSAFFDLLPRKRRYSFEFRNPSWYQPSVLKLLSARNIALCLSDHHDAPAPWKRTADFVYIRGHGPGGRYKGHYSQQMLSEWAGRIRSWKRQGCDVFVYFDNDQKSAAPADALKLQHLLRLVPIRWNTFGSSRFEQETEEPNMAESSRQKRVTGRVMQEFKHGELRSGRSGKGGKVQSRRQAIAIALQEAGASKYDSAKRNRRNLRRTEQKEAAGRTAQQEREGKSHVGASRKRESTRAMGGHNARKQTARGHRTATARARKADGHTRQELYEKAKRRHVEGRSKMTKRQLENALGMH